MITSLLEYKTSTDKRNQTRTKEKWINLHAKFERRRLNLIYKLSRFGRKKV